MKILCTGGSGFIGTHLVDRFLTKDNEFINIDIAEPKKESHNPYWYECNILDCENLKKIFTEFQPTHVVHLAAHATMEGKTLDDFRDNTIGTANLLEAIKLTPSVSRAVITSSQHVRKPGSGFPKSDDDFVPHGLYGESKVITEKLTREAGLTCVWTIIRPTTVWGPWHPFLPKGLWYLVSRGLYFHPNNDLVVRNYGYVKNVVWQIGEIMQAPSSLVDRKVYYLGDNSIKQVDWINAFSRAFRGRDVLLVPKEWIHLLARIGDVFRLAGLRFPMDSSRYFNLTTTNPVPISPTIESFGNPPYSLDEGIQETAHWLKDFRYI